MVLLVKVTNKHNTPPWGRVITPPPPFVKSNRKAFSHHNDLQSDESNRFTVTASEAPNTNTISTHVTSIPPHQNPTPPSPHPHLTPPHPTSRPKEPQNGLCSTDAGREPLLTPLFGEQPPQHAGSWNMSIVAVTSSDRLSPQCCYVVCARGCAAQFPKCAASIITQYQMNCWTMARSQSRVVIS